MMMNSQVFFSGIKENRTYLMGIAICCVLVYHAFCWIYNPIGRLNIGYFGVDIFLFLSGLGLCFSYEKNSLLRFYKNRLLRIFPLYAFSVLIAYILCYKEWNFFVFIENLTTLGFYINYGVNRFDWYLNALIALYVLFPVFYFLAKLKYGGVILLTATVYIFMMAFHTSPYWWYDCFISRLPIFLYGIMFRRCYQSYKVVSCLGVLMFFPCMKYSSPFLATSFITLPLIDLFLIIIRHCGNKIKRCLKFCGQYSLEIYLANLIVYTLFHVASFGTVGRTILYVLIQLGMTAIFVFFTKQTNAILATSRVAER